MEASFCAVCLLRAPLIILAGLCCLINIITFLSYFREDSPLAFHADEGEEEWGGGAEKKRREKKIGHARTTKAHFKTGHRVNQDSSG